jgi:hypothetical protein
VGTPLLRTWPEGRLTLTAYGKRFEVDVTPVLKMPSQQIGAREEDSAD